MRRRALASGLIGVTLVALCLTSTAHAAVGRTPGTFSVSPTGAATYTIPIWMPAGPRGIQPSLAIVYSSQSGDGMLGPGWNLAGLSSITRCNPTYAQDQAPAAVTLSYGDRFCVDGQRLRLTSSSNLTTYGQPGTTYQTEIANFSNVMANGTTGLGPTSFTVQGKDGLYYEYGNTAGSRILYGTTVGQWLLNKVRDRNGNNYVVNYGTGAAGSANIGVPTSISYTPSSAGSTTYNYTVTFNYGTRAGQNPNTMDTAIVGYVHGVAVVNTNLLLNVTVSSSSSGSSVLVRQYTLGYGAAPTTTRARLTSVTECGGSAGTDCLPATNMTYQDGQFGLSVTANTAVASAPNNFVYGKYDFNGDGYNDVTYYNGTTWLVTFGSSTRYGAAVNTGAGGNMFGDFAGVGKDGLLAVNGSTWWYYAWNGTAFVGTTTGLAADTATTVADINGDGRPDLIYFSTVFGANGSVTVSSRLNTSTGGSVSFSSTLNIAYGFSGSVGSATLLTPLKYLGTQKSWDFNADGREDLALVWKDTSNPPSTWYYLELLAQGVTFSSSQVGPGSTAVTPPAVHFLKWNDDACPDTRLGSSIYISDCNGSTGSTLSLPFGMVGTLDWNGDGRSDLVVSNGSTLGVYLSTATGLGTLISTTIPYTSTCFYYTFDANGDGLDDLMCWDQLGSTVVKYYLHNGLGQPADLLTSVTDGYGIAANPTYVSLPRGNYTKRTDGNYADVDTILPLYVVNQFSASDGVGGVYTNSFLYFGAHLNQQGRGFDGFYERRVQDSRNGTYSYQYYERDFPKRGMLFEGDLYQSNNTTQISYFNSTNAATVLDSTAFNQRYFLNASSTTRRQYEVATGTAKDGAQISTETTSYNYDGYGNATGISSTITDSDALAPASPYNGLTWTTSIARTLSPDTGSWCLGLPTQVSVTKSAPSVLNITRTVGHTPDYVNCRETQQIIEPSSPTYKVTETFGFDSFGNINSDAVTGIGMTARTTLTDWGTTGQFPKTITNALSQPTNRGYNFDLGVQTSETDPNGIQTSWQPDNFGRRALETRPDGTTTVTTYNACASVSGGCQNGDPGSAATGINRMVVIATQKDSGGAVVRDELTYLDQLDRTIVTKSRLLSGGYSRVGTQYDALGRTYRRTAPCDAASCTAYWTTNSFDME